MKFQPLEDRCLVKPVKETELKTTQGGLYIPTTAKKEVAEGTVVATGPGRYASENGAFIPCMLNKGDKVLYGINQGILIEIDDEDGKKQEVKIMREGDVLLVISKKSAE